LEGSGCGLTEVLFGQLYVETEENHENISQDGRYPFRDMNRAPPNKSLESYHHAYLLGEIGRPVTRNCKDLHYKHVFLFVK
jgi:hypothetical protein